MDDKELLELAAKAHGSIRFDPMRLAGVMIDSETLRDWNPLTDDGDALQLAVKLQLLIDVGYLVSEVVDGKGAKACEINKSEPYAATRRAIVRAAAEIGRNMK